MLHYVPKICPHGKRIDRICEINLLTFRVVQNSFNDQVELFLDVHCDHRLEIKHQRKTSSCLHETLWWASFLARVGIFESECGKERATRPKKVWVVIAVLHDYFCDLLARHFLRRAKRRLLFMVKPRHGDAISVSKAGDI